MTPVRPIDLRSDTVTLPTQAMAEAMQRAPLGDDGLDGDPTVRELEALAARMLGKEEALFVVSGTMGNLVASLTHACSGGEVIVDAGAHMAISEAGGISRLAGLMCRALPAVGGEMDLDSVESGLRAGYSRHGPPTAMVVVESSHNSAAGAVPSMAYMQALHALARNAGSPVHLDGARLFNAAAALGCDAAAIAAHADSVTFCLSKGLSAPMGSMLAGSTAFIAKARTFRRMVGGGLRQAGVVAASGIVALQSMVARLQEDHHTARQLWQLLEEARPGAAGAPPSTNIVMFDTGRAGLSVGAPALAELFASAGVLVRARDRHTVRLVTHRHISGADVQDAVSRMTGVLDKLPFEQARKSVNCMTP